MYRTYIRKERVKEIKSVENIRDSKQTSKKRGESKGARSEKQKNAVSRKPKRKAPDSSSNPGDCFAFRLYKCISACDVLCVVAVTRACSSRSSPPCTLHLILLVATAAATAAAVDALFCFSSHSPSSTCLSFCPC